MLLPIGSGGVCESYMGCHFSVMHREIVGLRKLEKQQYSAEVIKSLGKRIEKKLIGQSPIPFIADKKLEGLASHFYEKIKKEKRYPIFFDCFSAFCKFDECQK